MSIVVPNQGPAPSRTAVLADQIWLRVQTRMEMRLGRLEELAAVMFDRHLTGEEVAEALHLCNTVASKLATLGVAAAADLIRTAASLIDQSDAGGAEAIGLCTILDDARVAVASTVAGTRITSEEGKHLLVVGPQMIQADEMMWVGIVQGMKVTYQELAPHPLGEGERPVDAVLVVAPDPDLGAARPLLRAIEQTFYGVPVVLLSPSNTLSQRLRGVQQFDTIMDLNAHPLEVMNEVRLVVARQRQNHKVVTIGRNSAWVAARLSESGVQAQSEQSASNLFRSVSIGEARGVVIVEDADSMTSLDLVELIRSDITTREAVVVVMEKNPDYREMLLDGGADNVFGGDVAMAEVAALLNSRLNRSATTKTLAEAEVGQGALAWPPAVVLIERLLMGSMRRNAPVGLALLQLPLDKSTDRDEQIAREFRRGDVVARYDAEHLVVVLDGVTRQTLVSRMRSLGEKFNLKSLGCRIGGMEFPVDGRSVEDLVTGGLRILDRVSSANGPMVVGADWRPHGERPSDVLILDPDETLGSVLQATMERRGFRVEYQPDSLEGLRYLTGATDKPLPRLVLLELQQQGVGGLQFLRQVRDAGNLGLTKVIVLSSRTIEAEMRQAFELGVEDFVAKPFSTPLLLHRIQRALED